MPKEVSQDVFSKTMQSHFRSRMTLVMAVFMTLHVQILIARAMKVEQDILAAKNAARKEACVEGKESIILPVHILALIAHYFTRLLLLFLVSKELNSMFFSCHFTISKSLEKNWNQNFCY